LHCICLRAQVETQRAFVRLPPGVTLNLQLHGSWSRARSQNRHGLFSDLQESISESPIREVYPGTVKGVRSSILASLSPARPRLNSLPLPCGAFCLNAGLPLPY